MTWDFAMKVNDYDKGTASIELVSNKYVSISCTQSNEIVYGASSVGYGGTSVAFDFLPLAFASTDILDIAINVSAEFARVRTCWSKKPMEAMVKTLAVSDCKAAITQCKQKIDLINNNCELIKRQSATIANKHDVFVQLDSVSKVKKELSQKKLKTYFKQNLCAVEESTVTSTAKDEIAKLDETIAILKEIQQSLKEIDKQRTMAGTTRSKQGTTSSETADMLNL